MWCYTQIGYVIANANIAKISANAMLLLTVYVIADKSRVDF